MTELGLYLSTKQSARSVHICPYVQYKPRFSMYDRFKKGSSIFKTALFVCRQNYISYSNSTHVPLAYVYDGFFLIWN